MPKRFERHRRGKYDWGFPAPRSAERAAAATEPAVTAPGRKDTRRWCKGKPGREHVLAIEFRPWYGRICHAVKAGSWLDMSGKGWHCEHREVCQTCGKILREGWKLTAVECPQWQAQNERREAAGVSSGAGN